MVSMQSACTWRSHIPSDKLPLYSTRPAITFPAAEHHRSLAGTELYCLVTRGTCVWTTCPQLFMPRVELVTSWSWIRRSNQCPNHQGTKYKRSQVHVVMLSTVSPCRTWQTNLPVLSANKISLSLVHVEDAARLTDNTWHENARHPTMHANTGVYPATP